MSVVNSIFPNPSDDKENQVAEGFAVLIDGDTAPRAIASGQYLFIKNHSALATGGYHATEAISSGSSITSSNVTADADGIVNALDEKVNTLSGKIGTVPTGTDVETQISTLNSNIVALTDQAPTKVTDCNDALSPMVNYYCESSASNKPDANWFFIRVLNKSGNQYTTQIATTMNSLNGDIYYRTRDSSGTWGSWQQLALNSNVTNKLDKTGFQVNSANASSYTFDAPRPIPGAYSFGLIFGSTGSLSTDCYLYIVFVNTQTNGNTVNVLPIKAHSSYTFSGSFNSSTNKLTINSSGTCWGGMCFLWRGQA